MGVLSRPMQWVIVIPRSQMVMVNYQYVGVGCPQSDLVCASSSIWPQSEVDATLGTTEPAVEASEMAFQFQFPSNNDANTQRL